MANPEYINIASLTGGPGVTPTDALSQNIVGQFMGLTGMSAAEAKAYIAGYHSGSTSWDQAAVAAYQGWLTDNPTTTPDGSSTGSSKGSSGPAGPSPRDIANAVASYAGMLTAWGMPVDAPMLAFIKQSVTQGLNSAAFLERLRKTKAYAKAFPGLIRANGTMRMTEAQYLSGYQAAKDYASSVGRPLSVQAYGLAIKNGNSPSEIKAKIEAVDILKSNRTVFREFSDYLQATGVTKKPLSQDDLRQFVMKQGPVQFEQAWTMANEAAVLSKFDVGVGPGDDVTWKDLKRLDKQLLPGEQPDYSALAHQGATLSASRLYKLGITKKDLVRLAFNAKNAPAIAERVKLALGTAEATATEQRANPNLTQQGLALGSPQVQATE